MNGRTRFHEGGNMKQHHEEYQINPFTPKKGAMVDELAVIVAILTGWWLANFGFQFILLFISENPAGNSMLTRLTFLSFPFHFWFTAQMLPLWFVILCVIYNLYIDKVSEQHSRRKDRTYE
jgi:putative solute:sodium symporter small subunit